VWAFEARLALTLLLGDVAPCWLEAVGLRLGNAIIALCVARAWLLFYRFERAHAMLRAQLCADETLTPADVDSAPTGVRARLASVIHVRASVTRDFRLSASAVRGAPRGVRLVPGDGSASSLGAPDPVAEVDRRWYFRRS
jgi:hypothetical protein